MGGGWGRTVKAVGMDREMERGMKGYYVWFESYNYWMNSRRSEAVQCEGIFIKNNVPQANTLYHTRGYDSFFLGDKAANIDCYVIADYLWIFFFFKCGDVVW